MFFVFSLFSLFFRTKNSFQKEEEQEKHRKHIWSFFFKHEREQELFLQNTKIVLSVFSKKNFKNRFKKHELKDLSV